MQRETKPERFKITTIAPNACVHRQLSVCDVRAARTSGRRYAFTATALLNRPPTERRFSSRGTTTTGNQRTYIIDTRHHASAPDNVCATGTGKIFYLFIFSVHKSPPQCYCHSADDIFIISIMITNDNDTRVKMNFKIDFHTVRIIIFQLISYAQVLARQACTRDNIRTHAIVYNMNIMLQDIFRPLLVFAVKINM